MTEIDLTASIGGLLLLGKPGNATQNVTRNVLAILGLFTSDFGSKKHVRLVWDNDEINVQAEPVGTDCDCSPKDPKILYARGEWHSPRCSRAMAYKLMTHRDLVYYDQDDDAVTYTFQWPRVIEHDRAVIATAFTELSNDLLWSSFMDSWKRLTDQMAEPRLSLSACGALEDGPELPFDEPSLPPQEVDPEGMDFDDMDFVPEPLNRDEHEYDAPEPEVKRGRGRPKGTTKAAKEQTKELIPGDFVSRAGQIIPALDKFGRAAADELGRMCSVVESIMTATEFPIETIECLKNSLDRLSLRAANLQFKGEYEADPSGCLNPFISVTLENVTSEITTSVRDLGLSGDKPDSWEKFCESVKVSLGKAKSMSNLLRQTGMGPVISEPVREQTDEL